MAELQRAGRLRKQLRLLGVFAISTGTTLSAGFFLLPGLAFKEAGPAIVLAYMLAVVPLVPAMLSIVELGTAMPRAGGVYYFLDRTFGPWMGTIGGIGTWLALILKVAFALVGIGAYVALWVPEVPVKLSAVVIGCLLGVMNCFGAKNSGKFQVGLVIGLLAILIFFIGRSLPEVQLSHFDNFMGAGWSTLLSTTGFVYISYVGVTKIASLSEEIENPERNLPLGVFLALGTTVAIYGLGTWVMVGLVPAEQLSGSMTPVVDAAGYLHGGYWVQLLSIAALLAFFSVANAGILSASRYPLAMSRDHILPLMFRKLSSFKTPMNAVFLTVIFSILIILLVEPVRIAKLASAFQLFLFAVICLAVIVMRESHLDAYDPGFRSPFYPWMQIAGVFIPLVLICMIGWLPLLFTLLMILASTLWYFYYVRGKVKRGGAIYHIFERLGRLRYEGLDRELRGILKEKGLRHEDPFEETVARSLVIDLPEDINFETTVARVSKWLSQHLPHTAEEIETQFLEGTRIGATPVTRGVALPHLRVKGLTEAEMVLVRSKTGVLLTVQNPLTNQKEEQTVYALFFLVSPLENPTQHLRILAQIAEHVENENFTKQWNGAKDEQELKEVLLRDECCLSLVLSSKNTTRDWLGREIKHIDLPDGCLIALLRRDHRTLIPDGATRLAEGDRLTLIGHPAVILQLTNRFEVFHAEQD